MKDPQRSSLLRDLPALKDHIEASLQHSDGALRPADNPLRSAGASAVLFLFGRAPGGGNQPVLILTKRSTLVRQPGDLCCPGGSIAPRKDVLLAGLLRMPFSPLCRWRGWSAWRRAGRRQAFSLSLLLATGLRESFEEMRLNPLRVEFLGPLPPQRLVMFRRTIYPLVCWVHGRKRFTPNWEVDKIVYLPLRRLLDPAAYGRLRLGFRGSENSGEFREFPCLVHRQNDKSERLWGATFRIAMVFLERAFGFQPPPSEDLPLFEATLTDEYRTGAIHR